MTSPEDAITTPRRAAARSFSKPQLAAVVLLVCLAAASVIVPFILGDLMTTANLELRNQPPWLLGGPAPHLLGTDPLGRDVLGRLLVAVRVSLGISLVVMAISVPVGAVAGILAGYRRGWVDQGVMRTVDVVMSFPTLLLSVFVLYVIGGGLVSVVIVLAATRWPVFARLARAESLRIREFAFVEAARALGYGHTRMIRDNFIPNLTAPILALAIVTLPQVMLGEAALSFLGLGIQPPDTSLGLMVAQGRAYVTSAWWLVVFPGLAIVLMTIAIGSLVSAASYAFDPTARDREIRS